MGDLSYPGRRTGFVCLLLAILAVVGTLGIAGCSSIRAGDGDDMLQFLEDKYGEKFVVETLRGGSEIDPSIYGHGGGMVHLESDPSQVFVVVEDPEQPGGFSDERVLADWTRTLMDSVTPEVQGIFGDDAAVGVSIVSPDAFDLIPDEIGVDPRGIMRERLPVSSCVVMVIEPLEPGREPQDYAAELFSLYDVASSAGANSARVRVWFVDAVTDEMVEILRAAGAPNSSIDYRDVPGAIAYGGFESDSGVQSVDDVAARIEILE